MNDHVKGPSADEVRAVVAEAVMELTAEKDVNDVTTTAIFDRGTGRDLYGEY